MSMLYCALKHLLRGYISCYVFSPQNKQTRNTKGLKETCGGDGYVCYLDCGGSIIWVYLSKVMNLYTSVYKLYLYKSVFKKALLISFIGKHPD